MLQIILFYVWLFWRFDILCFLNAVSKIQFNFEISRTDNKRLDWFFCKIYLEILRRRHFGNWVQLISRELMQPWKKKKNGKISLLNTVGKTEYIYIKVILDGWPEDVMINGYICSATSIYFEGIRSSVYGWRPTVPGLWGLPCVFGIKRY